MKPSEPSATPAAVPSKPPATPPAPKPRAEFADGLTLEEFRGLATCTCFDPHRLLGSHPGKWEGVSGVVVRAWHPHAKAIAVVRAGKKEAMKPLGIDGLFGLFIPAATLPLEYTLFYEFAEGTWETHDAYSFLPTLGELDLYLHGEGNHYRAWEKFGARLVEQAGVKGVAFSVWAPSAKRVSVIGDFNGWDGHIHYMRSMGGSGVWELFLPGIGVGERYKYEILTQDGHLRVKADPYTYGFDIRPSTHSKVVDLNTYQWNDHEYMAAIPERNHLESPMSIYEVHLGSWMRVPEEGNRWLNYRELAHRLVPHMQALGFTHVELMPVAEHPFDGSWGYQVTGYYAPTSRFGTPEDFKYFVDYMHRNGFGVVVDWVPAHFPKDDFALRWFDGTALYEHLDPRKGEHKDWGTLIFNYGRPEVKTFLLSNALFWLDHYHVDALRVDAVASMLYLDYSRQAGEWEPNIYGGNENLEAIALLRQLNEVVHGQYPGRFTVAEESTSFTGVSRPTYLGGLGFTFKWNMGWMNDTLRYFSHNPIYRQYHQNDLTFALIYQYTENFILPFSHDEVVHGKGSMLSKMPGDDWQKFANLRLLLAYMYAHPGKKLIFQGAEWGQWAEWDYSRSADWDQLTHPPHAGILECLKSLGQMYRNNSEFWRWDNEPRGFRWIDFTDHASSVLSYSRFGPDGHTICIFNFTPVARPSYRIGLPTPGPYREVFNSDSALYWGSNSGNGAGINVDHIPMHGQTHSADLCLPPLGAVFLKHGK